MFRRCKRVACNLTTTFGRNHLPVIFSYALITKFHLPLIPPSTARKFKIQNSPRTLKSEVVTRKMILLRTCIHKRIIKTPAGGKLSRAYVISDQSKQDVTK